MKLKAVTLPFAILIIIATLIATYAFFVARVTHTTPRVCVAASCFNVDIASTPAERERGLMDVKTLPPEQGMLFVFEKNGAYSFWMKNTLIPLDIIWINEESEIVFIKHNAQPCGEDYCANITPPDAARYVLEVNGGTAARLGWEVGDEASFYSFTPPSSSVRP